MLMFLVWSEITSSMHLSAGGWLVEADQIKL